MLQKSKCLFFKIDTAPVAFIFYFFLLHRQHYHHTLYIDAASSGELNKGNPEATLQIIIIII